MTNLLTSAEVAERLYIDRSTLTRYVQAGRIVPKLRGTGVRGQMFFDPADVDRLALELAS